MKGYYVKKIGQNRGSPRIWLEGRQAGDAGLGPGDRYEIVVHDRALVLKACKDGSRTVSAKKVGDRVNPVIDLNSTALLKVFEGMDAVRVVVRQGEVLLIPLASEVRKKERLARIRKKFLEGKPLLIGSVSHGGGILSHAIHAGLAQAGVPSRLAFANEIREELLAHSAVANDVVDDDTQLLAAPMQELAQDERALSMLGTIDIYEAGIPCSGASVAGRAKRGLALPEDHPEVGHLVYSALVIMSKVQPVVVLIENVPPYASSASASILRWQLRDMGYDTHEAILRAKDFGALEDRERWCMVATTKGLSFSFDQLQPTVSIVRKLGDILEPVAPDDPSWSSFGYLRTKAIRDKEKGNGFAIQEVTPESTRVPTLRKGYAKGGSTDPLLRHPSEPDLLRKLTPVEHSRAKQVPEHLVAGFSATVAHEVLGQGIVYEPFVAVGRRIGETVRDASDGPATSATPVPPARKTRMPSVG